MRARVAHAAVARAISGFEKVTMAVRPQDVDEARFAIGKGVEIFETPLDDSWARDNGPIFVVDDNDGVAGVHWRFNAWGNKYLGYEEDAAWLAAHAGDPGGAVIREGPGAGRELTAAAERGT